MAPCTMAAIGRERVGCVAGIAEAVAAVLLLKLKISSAYAGAIDCAAYIVVGAFASPVCCNTADSMYMVCE